MVQEVAKSNEYSKESVKEISREDVKNVKEFKNYYQQASAGEKQRLNREFSQNLQNEIDKDSRLKSAIEGVDDVDSEIRNQDIENINQLNVLRNSLSAYPNLPEANRQAINKMVYGPFEKSEREIQTVLNSNEKTKDAKIES